MRTIGITAWGSVIGDWDPDAIGRGLPGSEEAVVYMAEHLARQGERVLVYGTPPEGSRHGLESANPRYLRKPIRERLDIAISWRMPEMGVELQRVSKKVYLWPHDPCQIRMTKEECDSYAGILWLSKTQREQWCAINPELTRFEEIFGNGLEMRQFGPVVERSNPYSCIYGSNYGAGLELLLEIWPCVKKQYPRAELAIYYGWNHWGFLNREQEMALRARVIELAPFGVTEHGRVGHAALNEAYGRASFWTYPCSLREMFCITALRAQLAGAIPVIALLQGSGLKETVRYGYACGDRKNYCETLLRAMADAEQINVAGRTAMGQFIRESYSWQNLAHRWLEYFVG